MNRIDENVFCLAYSSVMKRELNPSIHKCRGSPSFEEEVKSEYERILKCKKLIKEVD